MGYPQIIPASGTCPDLLPLATGDYAYARRINELLASTVQEAARASGAEYVDVFRASAGHDICAKDPWINGLVTDPARPGAQGTASGHCLRAASGPGCPPRR